MNFLKKGPFKKPNPYHNLFSYFEIGNFSLYLVDNYRIINDFLNSQKIDEYIFINVCFCKIFKK